MLLSEKTTVSVGLAIILGSVALSVWASVNVSAARTDEKLNSQQKQLEIYNADQSKTVDYLRSIDQRLSRIEGAMPVRK